MKISAGLPAIRLSERQVLALALVAALLHGLLYLFLVPPWQHYDEPKHFEYAWLAANLGRLPKAGDYDPQISRQVLQSMIDNQFYPGQTGSVPEGREVKIPGYSQLDEKPLYYLLAALPMMAAREASVEAQLRLGRAVSLLLLLVSVLAAWGSAREVAAQDNPLRWMAPLSLALLPGFVDMMTALNNDAGAIALFSLFTWAAVCLIRRGLRGRLGWLALLGMTLAAGLSYFVKSTAMLIMPLYFVALLFAVLRGRLRWIALALAGVVGLGALGLIFTWGDAAYWARSSDQPVASRLAYPAAPLGEHALALQAEPQDISPSRVYLRQRLPYDALEQLQGQTVTLGAWVWADRSLPGRSQVLLSYPRQQFVQRDILLTETPTFHAFTTTVKDDSIGAWVSLMMPNSDLDTPLTVYADGLVLVEGEYPVDQAPVFADENGQSGVWGGQPFTNLLRNGSAEQAWPMFRPWVDRLGMRLLPDPGYNRPSLSLYTILDLPSTYWYYRYTLQEMVRTYWGKFGWAKVALLGHKPYRPIYALVLLGVIGAGAAIWRARRRLDWGLAIFLAMTALGVWSLAFVRGSNYLLLPVGYFVPVARYVYPAIVPVMLALNAGWLEIMRLAERWLRIPLRFSLAAYVAMFIFLDIYSVLSILSYY